MIVRFARDLRLLREKAGTPTYRELGARAHYSAAVLSEAASGRRLPSLPVTMAYVTACGGSLADWETRWRTITADVAATKAAVQNGAEGQPPYVGLAAFQREDAGRFFGREQLVADLARRLAERRFLGVLGSSGCGKSSLLRAGLAARLADERDRGDAPVVVFTPGSHPIEECAIHLAGFLGESPQKCRYEFLEDPRNLHLRIRQAVASYAAESDAVLIVDQFEELFTICADEHERAVFIDALVIAASDSASRVRIVLGIRADFLGHCGDHPGLVSALRDGQVLVGPMTTDELRLAITRPAELAGYRLETALITRLVGDAARQPGVLPLVSHALLQTWLHRQGAVMTVAGYDAVGGIEHAVARSAEHTFQALCAAQRDVAKHTFLRLTALGDGTEDTKRRINRDELDQDDPNTRIVLDTLTSTRLITVGDNSVEIAHEALIRHWPRLRAWLAEDRDGHRIQRQLTEAANDWERGDRDDCMLYRGGRLATWQDRSIDRLNEVEHAFLAASRAAAERVQRSRRRRVRRMTAGLSAVAVLVVVLALIALAMAARADHERSLAIGRQLIADARAQLQVDPELALLLARAAYTRAPNDDTESLLRQAVTDSHVRETLHAREVGPRGIRAVSGVAFSADGKHLAISDTGGAVQVWDWQKDHLARREPQLVQGNFFLKNPVFSPNGSDIAAVSSDVIVRVRNWAEGGSSELVPGQQGVLSTVVYSPDGRHLASGGQDGTIWIRDVADNGAPMIFHAHDRPVTDLAFSANGRNLVSSGQDGTVRIWDLSGNNRPMTLRASDISVESVAVNADGQVVSANSDGTIRTWNPGTGDSAILGVHPGGANAVAYSADGHRITTVGVDRTVRVWNSDLPAEPVVLRGHRGPVDTVTFSPNGETVVSGSVDGTAKVWQVAEVENLTTRRSHHGPVMSTAVSLGGQVIIGGSANGSVQVWDTLADHEPVVLSGNDRPVTHVTSTPDGRYVAAVTVDGASLIWKLDDPANPTQLTSHSPVTRIALTSDSDGLIAITLDDGSLMNVKFLPANPTAPVEEPVFVKLPGGYRALLDIAISPDGHKLAAITIDNTVLEGNHTDELTDLSGRQGPIQAMAYSGDGTRLATAGNDGTVWQWYLDGHTKPLVLRGKQDVVYNLTYSMDGHLLLASGSDNTVRIWRTNSTGAPLVLDGFGAAVHTVTTLSGNRYATTHDDGTIQIWRCPTCASAVQLLTQADQNLTRDLTPEERRTYLPEH